MSLSFPKEGRKANGEQEAVYILQYAADDLTGRTYIAVLEPGTVAAVIY